MGGIYGAHDAYFVEEGESVGWVVGEDCVLLGEGLHCEVPLVGQSLHLVYCGKAALAELLDGFVESVEAQLVERPGEQPHPDLDDTFSQDDDLHGLRARCLKGEPDWSGVYGGVGGGCGEFLFVDEFKLEVVVEGAVVLVSLGLQGWVCECDVGVREDYP